MSIAILVPTRGRPEQYYRMLDSACITATPQKLNVYTAINRNEEYIRPQKFNGFPNYDSWLMTPDNLPTVHKWNLLAQEALKNAQNKLFMLGADDTVFATPLWDKALLDHYNALENKIHVYALQDSRDPEGTPHPIVTREWIEFFGWAFPPIFLHWYLDSWTVEIAKANGCFTHMKDYLLIHDKPSDRGEGDETHNRIRQMGWRERDQYVADTCKDWKELQINKLKEKLHG